MMQSGIPGSHATNVSRETTERLEHFQALVRRWSPSINLISKRDLDEIGPRHIADSSQIINFLAAWPKSWVDLGSGGGFPGIVIAVLAKEFAPATHTTLIESDNRKGAFLRTVCRELQLNATVHTERIEDVTPQHGGVISARALAPLDRLLPLVDRHLAPDGVAFLLKGRRWEREIEAAKADWTFTHTKHTSTTDPDAALLELRNMKRAKPL